ncbi:hypothetical protein [Hymenobacter lapidiphilus]|uniref:hypothetical protein n=1 Tax=Hymenobacter sp. CCM 8763 TaxID=2303334 RepID=UPI0011C18017|nr:hypothetical protein [Hymenobacter sp. CCM 8763]
MDKESKKYGYPAGLIDEPEQPGDAHQVSQAEAEAQWCPGCVDEDWAEEALQESWANMPEGLWYCVWNLNRLRDEFFATMPSGDEKQFQAGLDANITIMIGVSAALAVKGRKAQREAFARYFDQGVKQVQVAYGTTHELELAQFSDSVYELLEECLTVEENSLAQ